MVAFTCNACGESVKKNKVEKHLMQCSGCSSLSCMDCGQSFYGDSYTNHTKCISEAEKYQGKLFQAKDKVNKGEKKQLDWTKNLQSMTASKNSTNPRINSIIQKIANFDNVPRKKKKFINFMKNSVKVYNEALLNQVWELFAASMNGTPDSAEPQEKGQVTTPARQEAVDLPKELPVNAISEEKKTKKVKKEKSSSNVETSSHVPNTSAEPDKENRKAKKRKLKENGEDSSKHGKKKKVSPVSDDTYSAEKPHTEKFNWKKTISRIVKSTEKGSISMKHLKKKVTS
ncbi:uncharacterized protein TRIADDRAFT_51055 [Trichoplax adhaerens]|uniref:Uncharacterized protein n=1 Tax=Trichoplax adhaerens TaxID=10228 RepID=B3SAZ1_TRIAD|nr:hypothetical protein TRIADDRAFT_51055 [Trichoplax adhaerens]EDV20072.1 hypothetical protein TRIADDRAFT_51055 [Trichoplax adhaerens]|eukprot:XP_002117456.1 hypothetical protein TRIADDRAFT_51055 [Trichoplax adhaerens]